MFHIPAQSVRLLAFLAVGWLALAQQAQAVYTIHIQQIGPDVQVDGSGSINTTALNAEGDPYSPAGGALQPNQGAVVFPGTLESWTMPGFSGSGPFGSGLSSTFTLDTSGDGLAFTPTFMARLYLPVGYVSGTTLTSSMTFAGQTLASLGITPGNYAWNFDSGAASDSVRMTVDSPPAPASIPTLSEWGLLGLSALMAALGLGWLRRRPGA